MPKGAMPKAMILLDLCTRGQSGFKMATVTDFSEQPPHEEGRKEKVRALLTEGLSLFPSFPLHEGAVH